MAAGYWAIGAMGRRTTGRMRDGSDQGTKGCWVGGVISVGRLFRRR